MGEPRAHDFTRQMWGHALHNFRDVTQGIMSGSCHSMHPIRDGDTMTWLTPYGRVTGVIERSSRYADPDDMYRLERVRVTERVITSVPTSPDRPVGSTLPLPPLCVAVEAPGWEIDADDPSRMIRRQ